MNTNTAPTDDTTPSPFFFDGWGGLWVTCAPNEPGAMPGGPQWTCKEVSDEVISQLWRQLGSPEGEWSLYLETKKKGWQYEDEDGWTYLRFVVSS
jgi:hypothetical protein